MSAEPRVTDAERAEIYGDYLAQILIVAAEMAARRAATFAKTSPTSRQAGCRRRFEAWRPTVADLHSSLLEAITARRDRARPTHDAEPGPWGTRIAAGKRWVVDADGDFLAEVGTDGDALFIAAENPAAVLRQVERDLRVLDRHKPWLHSGGGLSCATCQPPDDRYPCAEIVDLAAGLGVEVRCGYTVLAPLWLAEVLP